MDGDIAYDEKKICYVRNIPMSCSLESCHEFLASSRFNQEGLRESERLKFSKSRKVYVFSVGNSSSIRITLNDHSDRNQAMSRIKKGSLDEVLNREFVSQQYAIQYARDVIREFKVEEVDGWVKDDGFVDLDFLVSKDLDISSYGVDTLAHILEQAKGQNAVIIVPDYVTNSKPSLEIQAALNYVDFRGPVINCTMDDWIVCDSESFNKKTYVYDKINDKKSSPEDKGVVLDRTTNSFQVSGYYKAQNEIPYAKCCARLAKYQLAVSRTIQRRSILLWFPS